jgi:molecular chaperone HscB
LTDISSPTLSLGSTDFGLFGLPERYELDSRQLADRWRALQAKVHPDRFAADGAVAQRTSMQWSVRLNEAYSRLKDPLKRAAYLCALRGVPVDAERHTAMPASFLMQQMQWRETLEDAQSQAALEALGAEVRRTWRLGLERVRALLDERDDPNSAAQEVRALMFVEKILDDIQARQDALDGA